MMIAFAKIFLLCGSNTFMRSGLPAQVILISL